MTCDPRDQELLLLAHGELPVGRRLRLQAHLRRCPQCRARFDEFVNTSVALAAALRDPNATTWRPDRPRSPRLPLALLAALALLMGLLYFSAVRVARLFRAPSQPTTSAPSEGCRPDLPNDRCR